MDCLRIMGGARLHGTIAPSGAKNAALPIMAAAILADAPVLLDNVPDVADVNTLALLLGHLGVEAKRGPDGTLRLETIDATPTRAPYELVRRMRASFCVLGPLVARRGRAIVSLPGGCNIGTRPVDLHLAGLAALGATIRIRRGYVQAEARELVGTTIDMRGPCGPTVTGTANVMCAATLARGRTVLIGAALEPEVVDLGRFLIALGANIAGLGTRTIVIDGVERLAGTRHRVIADRIEAGTLLIAGAITQGSVTVEEIEPAQLTSLCETLSGSGVEIAQTANSVTATATARMKPAKIVALPFPGIPTDLQAQLMALATLARGTSRIRDRVFPDRHMHIAELIRLGARIERRGTTSIVHGVSRLSGAVVTACDLRASAALVLAGLAAEGETFVREVHHLDRGYERLEQKLAKLGAQIERVRECQVAERGFQVAKNRSPRRTSSAGG